MDAVTGAPDSRAWEQELERRVAGAYRGRYSLLVALLELDHFEEFTGERGAEAGKQLLTGASEAWRRHLRPEDQLSRYGEAGFGVILSRVALPAAERVVSRLKEATPEGQSFSAGIALWNGSEDAAQLVARADDALFAAKQAGRNRYVVHGADEHGVQLPEVAPVHR